MECIEHNRVCVGFFKGWPQLELYFNQMQRTEHTFINFINCCLHQVVNPGPLAP